MGGLKSPELSVLSFLRRSVADTGELIGRAPETVDQLAVETEVGWAICRN